MEDVTLIKACQQGDLEAFEQLVKRYEHTTIKTAYLITRNRELAKDIVQEVFIQCYTQIHSLRQPEYFRTWLYRILVRLSSRALQRERWKSIFSLQKSNIDWGYDPKIVEEVENKETYNALYDSVNALREKFRVVIILYYFNEMTTKEIANILSISDGTVKSRLHKARNQIHKSLTSKGIEHSIVSMEGGSSNVGDILKKNAERTS
ncbi:RNA polymerase sigma factor [Brevibacillus migulae]|uniref:RNA polymerase sigma factor n=1 Tax=Brevibacillus migulae TaxID=1644114 RepID=UPI00142F86D4|nr:sigma-70 family RNA polymerase sigma factor [Brevibacillus migulae]